MAEGTLSRLLEGLRSSGRAAFIPYITAGDPSLEWTGRFLEALVGAGSDAVELGVPFSDPVADGPVNQRSAERALRSKTTLTKILDFVNGWRAKGGTAPIVLFTYFNPVLRMGLERFAQRSRESGVAGVLALDLPPEEAGEYLRAMGKAGVDTVFLASPTTSEERLKLIDRASTGFVYYVSRLGVTGTRPGLPEELAEELERVRRRVSRPVAVGFGISTPEQAAEAARHADAVVAGSALVRLIEEHDPKEAERRMAALAAAMAASVRMKAVPA